MSLIKTGASSVTRIHYFDYENREYRIGKAKELEELLTVNNDGLTEIERDKLEYERIKKEADSLRDRLSCAERDFFDIKAYAQWS